ncbi:hypothetical protein Q5752_003421 [Cryptotrichosporon argae]
MMRSAIALGLFAVAGAAPIVPEPRALSLSLPGITIDAGNILSIGVGGVTVTLGKADATTTATTAATTPTTTSVTTTPTATPTTATEADAGTDTETWDSTSSLSSVIDSVTSSWIESVTPTIASLEAQTPATDTPTTTATPTSTKTPTTTATPTTESTTTATTTTSSSTAATATSTGCASASGDAPYSLSCSDLESVITFPNGNQGKAGGIVFLVHGTGSTGEETWGSGPYYTILPDLGDGYDIAWFTSPTRSLGDAQETAEYIAYNIKALAAQSTTGQVFLIGHSQGNINIQWALEFWPSTRDYVSGFVSLAGDFHGTAEGPLLCVGQDLLEGGCEPGVLQQNVGSHYLAALNAQGGSALVSTTSLYTLYDDIVQPELTDPTSQLSGSSFLSVQDACTDAFLADHFTMTVTAPAFYLTYDALTHGGQASLSRFDASTQCTFLVATGQTDPFSTVAGVIEQAALDAIAVAAYAPKVTAEPKLMDYVCDAGAASSYCESS